VGLELKILGPVEARFDDEPIPLGTGQERALLALLALNVGRVVSTDRLAEELWSGDPPAQAGTTLRVYVSHLRKSLSDGRSSEDPILTRKPGYELQLPADAIDAYRFEMIAGRARTAGAAGDHRRAAALFREALDLWRGPALADLTHHAFAQAEAIRLEESRLAVLEERIAADLMIGRHAELVGELDLLTGEHPLRERLWGHRITALYRSGRQADALAAIRELRERLADELGIDPSPELQDLERKILLHDAELAGAFEHEHPPRDVRLPEYRTSFFGRAQETASLDRNLSSYQLVTLTGVGGCGKTRLAIEGARALSDRFSHGVFFADLGSVADPEGLPNTVATSLGLVIGTVSGGSGRPVTDEIVDFLRGRQALLILDNCEHLLEASAGIADAILVGSRDVRVLATSREPLGVEGERVMSIPSLGLPNQEDPYNADSVRLFADRAAAARSDFQLTPENAPAVADICRRLDGIPLAIELAASRVAHLAPDQIAVRLNDRFRLLTGGKRKIQRQQTLQAAMDWSYELLDEEERAFLRRLAVFASDFSLEAAERVAGYSLGRSAIDVLGSLVSKSLVGLTERGTTVRYRLPETVRIYAEERLAAAGESDAARARHFEYFLEWIDRIPEEDIAKYSAFDPEYPDLTSALDYAEITGNPEAMAKILAQTRALWWFISDWKQGVDFYDRAVAIRDRLDRKTLLGLMAMSAGLAAVTGNFEKALERSRAAVEIGTENDGYSMVEALFTHGSMLVPIDREGAIANFERAIRIATELTPSAVALVRIQQAEAWMAWDEFAKAREDYRAAAKGAPAFYHSTWALCGEAMASHLLEDHRLAMEATELALRGERLPDMHLIQAGYHSLVSTLHAPRPPATTTSAEPSSTITTLVSESSQFDPFVDFLSRFAHILALSGLERFEEAQSSVRGLLTTAERTRLPGGVATCLLAFATIASARKDFERASRLLPRSNPGLVLHSVGAVNRHYVRLVRQELGPERARRCRNEGLAMSLDEAIVYATETP